MKRGPALGRNPTRRQYRYFPVSYPSRHPLVHAMRPDLIGRTVCGNAVQDWGRLDGSEITCATCRRWVETQQAEVVA